MKTNTNTTAWSHTLTIGLAVAVLALCRAADATVIDISAGPNGWGCSQCSGPQNVLPGTVVNLVNAGEPGPLQLILNAGSYTITNAATSGNYSAWNFEGYPNSGNWVWSFMIGSDNGNGTATVIKDDYIAGIYATQADAAGATTTTWNGNSGNPADQLPGTSTAGFVDTLTLSTTTTLDFFIDDYALGDNGGGVALNISSGAPEPSSLVLIGAGLIALLWRRKRASGHCRSSHSGS